MSHPRLANKTALITAAGQGIGRASAIAMAEAGAEVCATDVNPALLESLKGIPGITTQVLDVMDKAAIQRVVASLPKLNVLFNCAGFVHHGNIEAAADKDWDFAFDLNVRSQFWAIQAALPVMLNNGGGSIINMASIVSVRGLPNRFIYGASKAAVIGLTKSVAIDYVKQNIRCNCLCPGTVDTPSLGDRINAFEDPVAARKNFIDRQPMGRLASAAEIAPTVVFLASDEASFYSGEALHVNGGMTI
ncbi:MAG: SDR family oxidoreductase [Burkholderiaceae bacterium]